MARFDVYSAKSVPASTDTVLIYDRSGTAIKQVTVGSLTSSLRTYLISTFNDLITALNDGDREGAIAILDQAILDLDQLG